MIDSVPRIAVARCRVHTATAVPSDMIIGMRIHGRWFSLWSIDTLLNISRGYASLDYHVTGMAVAL